MKNRKNLLILFSLSLSLLFTTTGILFGRTDSVSRDKVGKTSTLEFIQFDVNDIRAWVGNNGQIVSNIPTGDAGLEWKKGTGLTAVFASGLWTAGKVNGEIRSAASEFTSEFNPGSIIYNPLTPTVAGVPDNPNDTRFQVSSINKGDSSNPASPNFNREYATWPSSDGAPAHDGEIFTDVNKNGVYDDGEPYEDFNLDGVFNYPDGKLVTGEDPPQMTGDQMHWFVINDANVNTHGNLWNTLPLGIEVQTTLFGFDRSDPLGDIMFVKWLIINKGGHKIDDMLLSIWADIDLGDANDDMVGCDTALSVGYFYNGYATDTDYGNTPPAVGYDFFQGPIVPSVGSTALVSGQKFNDYRNLPMTSFVKYINSNPTYRDPENAEEAYNYMSGLTLDGEPWYDPSGAVTKFLYPGNPVTGTGWTEYDDDTPQDHRFLMSTGPINMKSWEDTDNDGFPQVGEPGVQEIVAAIIIAQGTNNLNAIDAMKFFDQYAQAAYDAQFVVASPLQPIVKTSELDREIIFSWMEKADDVESYDELGYTFQGYNVYQGESANGPWTRLATYDIVDGNTLILDKSFDPSTALILEGPVQYGTDSGLERMIDLKLDALHGNSRLINDRTYYFAVTSYALNNDAAPKTVESSKKYYEVKPHQRGVGEVLNSYSGEDVDFGHVGEAEMKFSINVLDPLQLTGDTYRLGFEFDSTAMAGSWYMGRLSLPDSVINAGDTLVASSELMDYKSDFIDGFQFQLTDVSFKAPNQHDTTYQVSNPIPDKTIVDRFVAVSPGGVDSLLYYPAAPHIAKVDTLYGGTNYYDNFTIVEEGFDTYIDLSKLISHSVRISEFGGGGSGTDLARGVLHNGGCQDPLLLQSDLELWFTQKGQMASFVRKGLDADTMIWIPFELWDVERNKQLCVTIYDFNHDGEFVDTTNNTFESSDYIISMHKDYDTYNDSLMGLKNSTDHGWLWQFGGGSKYSIGDTVLMTFINPVRAGIDFYTFSPEALDTAVSIADQKKQLNAINVFPNPYFAFNVEETQPVERFVRFTHLPVGACTLRIFTLGGQLVKKIDHGSTPFAGTTNDQWDMLNESSIPVASGMYIVHITVPNVGEKILKLAVFLPEERLDIY